MPLDIPQRSLLSFMCCFIEPFYSLESVTCRRKDRRRGRAIQEAVPASWTLQTRNEVWIPSWSLPFWLPVDDKGLGTFSTLIWFVSISERAAQETAVGRLCPRRLEKLHLSPSLLKIVKLVSDVAEIKRFAKGHRKSATETGPNVGPSLQGETIVGQSFLGRRCQTLIHKCPLWDIPLQSLGQPWKIRPGQEHGYCLIYQTSQRLHRPNLVLPWSGRLVQMLLGWNQCSSYQSLMSWPIRLAGKRMHIWTNLITVSWWQVI